MIPAGNEGHGWKQLGEALFLIIREGSTWKGKAALEIPMVAVGSEGNSTSRSQGERPGERPIRQSSTVGGSKKTPTANHGQSSKAQEAQRKSSGEWDKALVIFKTY
ncbi:hypothetical protein Scep_006984 [Stephania cephalantha]|uniref:Uncharacterized protein n=1 Tax=Stephania cephalantha TaxID=152367 RepID=A0AAP0K968_9MAGN